MIITAHLVKGDRRDAVGIRLGAPRRAMVKGLFYVRVTTSLFIRAPSTFLLLSNAGDQIVYASLAIGGIATALATRTAPR